MKFIEQALSYLNDRWKIPRRVVAYLISGALAALVELAVLYVLTDFLNIWYMFSLFLAFWMSLAVSFTLQKFWTFQDHSVNRIHIQGPSYFGVALLGLSINSVLLYFMVESLHMWYILGQTINYAVIALLNFMLYKFVIFKKPADLQ